MNSEQKVVRRRRTRSEIQRLVAEFLKSGMGQSEFCRDRCLSLDTLNRNLKKQPKNRKKTRRVPQLVAVEVASSQTTRENGAICGLAVVLSRGRRIEVESGFDMHTLERLVSTLERV